MTNAITTSHAASARPLAAIIASQSTLEGGGFEVYRPFPTQQLDLLDPFLLLDEMAPTVYEPGEFTGAPEHPHRGFETVTFVLDGEIEHHDSAGNHGLIEAGDVQWMTAGDGIVHSEMPSRKQQLEGGRAHGLQLWVNLPKALKRTPPTYQGLPAAELSNAQGPGWTATVVAGSMFGVTGPATTHTPVGYGRVTLEPGHALSIPVADGHTAAIYSFGGTGAVGPDSVALETNHLAVFERGTGEMRVSVRDDATMPLDMIVLTGEPLDEPVARYGPFVMNERAELVEAVEDFNAGRMGSITPSGSL